MRVVNVHLVRFCILQSLNRRRHRQAKVEFLEKNFASILASLKNAILGRQVLNARLECLLPIVS